MKSGLLFKKKSKQDTEGRVYVALYFKDQVELISTGYTVPAHDWDKSRQRLKSRTHLQKVEKILDNIRRKLDDLEFDLIRENPGKPVTAYMLKARYKETFTEELEQQLATDKRTKEGKRSLVYLANEWLENELFIYQASTQKSVRISVDHFLTFLKKSGNPSATLNDLGPDLISKFQRYLQSQGMSNSTAGKTLKHNRWFWKFLGYNVKDIRLPNSTKDKIALDMNELKAIETVELESSELRKSRDAFLLLCYTGMRVSDLKRVNPASFVHGKIELRQQKTGRELTVVVIKKVAEIFERYGHRAPKISDQKINENIKLVCKQAGITKLVNLRISKGGKYIDVQKPKYALITTHIGSKTFASTVAQFYGLNPSEIAAYTGKSLKTVLTYYLKPSLESALEKMNNHVSDP